MKLNKLARNALAAVTAGFFLTACSQGLLKDNEEKPVKTIYEIALNQAKPGEYAEFLKTRETFVDILGKEKATQNEGKWQPFFAIDPSLKLDRIIAGMTVWDSMEGFGEAAQRLVPQEEGVAYFSTFDPLAYALLETKDGKPFDLESIKKPGSAIEFAIRKGKTDDAFGEVRDTFFNYLAQYDGYEFAREFKVYKLDENGMPTLAENTQAVIIAWETAEQFQAGAQAIFASKEAADFFALIDVENYLATSPTE